MALLNGRVAIITGASRGIGAAIARRFAAEGAKVASIAAGPPGTAVGYGLCLILSAAAAIADCSIGAHPTPGLYFFSRLSAFRHSLPLRMVIFTTARAVMARKR